MHHLIEAARKSAGISGLQKNYPDDPKQRGAGFWAAFLGAMDSSLGRQDETTKKLHERISDLSEQLARKEGELNKLRSAKIGTGVDLLAEKHRWSVEDRRDALNAVSTNS